MLLALPFMRVGPKLRTWAALMGAAVAGMLLPPLPIGIAPPFFIIAGYVAIDFIAALVVLKAPAGTAQRLIGGLFAGMICFHIGFFIANAGHNVVSYTDTLSNIGWVQWACLLAWGALDFGKVVVGRFGDNSPSRDHRQVN